MHLSTSASTSTSQAEREEGTLDENNSTHFRHYGDASNFSTGSRRPVAHNFSSNTSITNGGDIIRRSSPLPSGLSALIQAATAQLGHLADVASTRESVEYSSPESTRRYQSEDTTVGPVSAKLDVLSRNVANVPSEIHDGQELRPKLQQRSGQTAQTPVIVPENCYRQNSLPEILMTLALDPENSEVITFLPDGKFFAIQSKKFVEDNFLTFFDQSIKTYDDFLRVINEWGFSVILDPSSTGISVFRHPNFVKGDWEKCTCIKYGVSPTKARLDALPDRTRIEYTVSDDSIIDAQQYSIHRNESARNNSVAGGLHSSLQLDDKDGHCTTKRRLSPGFLARRESNSSVSSQKQKVEINEGWVDPMSTSMTLNTVSFADPQQVQDTSGDESDVGVREGNVPSCAPSAAASYCDPSNQADDLRCLDLSVTVERLKIRHPGSSRRNSLADELPRDESTSDSNLVDRAVTSATQTIVRDAIETLLRDEFHTKETYLKHERALSQSTLPGVVPISKQLFSPSEAERHVTYDMPPAAASGEPKFMNIHVSYPGGQLPTELPPGVATFLKKPYREPTHLTFQHHADVSLSSTTARKGTKKSVTLVEPNSSITSSSSSGTPHTSTQNAV